MTAAEDHGGRGLELVAEQTDRAASIICRGTLDARGVPRLRMAISWAEASSIGTSRLRALRRMISDNSSIL